MGTNVTTAFITCPQNPQETLGIKLPFLVMIIKNVLSSLFSSKNILLFRFRFWMIKMSEEDLEPPIINRLQEWSHSSALCLWDWTRAGIKFSSTYQILQGEPMAAIIFRLYEWQFMRTVVLEEYISLTDCTAKRNYLQSSSCFFRFRNNNDLIMYVRLYRLILCAGWIFRANN